MIADLSYIYNAIDGSGGVYIVYSMSIYEYTLVYGMYDKYISVSIGVRGSI